MNSRKKHDEDCIQVSLHYNTLGPTSEKKWIKQSKLLIQWIIYESKQIKYFMVLKSTSIYCFDDEIFDLMPFAI